ncbi:hydroxymethylglutaryl-CoA lyase, partial [Acinetobacter baumannii]|nr:hydroxymethylglutaryl-CoA lyase [Acinetobacter baumannii]
LKSIEVGSCVSTKWVPQMAQSDELFKLLPQTTDVQISLLTPNVRGFETAQAVGCKEVAVYTAATESFTRKNINCSIDESFEKFSDVLRAAKAHNICVRGYVS